MGWNSSKKRNDSSVMSRPSARQNTERLTALDASGSPIGESAHIWEGACTISEVDRLLSEIISLDDSDLDSDTNRLAG